MLDLSLEGIQEGINVRQGYLLYSQTFGGLKYSLREKRREWRRLGLVIVLRCSCPQSQSLPSDAVTGRLAEKSRRGRIQIAKPMRCARAFMSL